MGKMDSLFKSEMYKLLADGKRWIVIAVVLTAKVVFLFWQLNIDVDFSPEIYRQYIDRIAEMPPRERPQYIEDRYAELNEIISVRGEKEKDYHAGKITIDEYKVYVSSYYEAVAHQPAFAAIYEKQQVYAGLPESNRVFYYDLNLELLFSSLGFDYFVFVLFIAVFVPFFCCEYSCGIFPMISVTERGGKDLLRVKLFTAVCGALLLGVLIYAADFAVYALKYGTEYFDMPIRSVRGVICGFSDFSAAQYLLLITGIKLLWTVCLTAVIGMMSMLSKNPITASLLTVAAVLMPWLLSFAFPSEINRALIGSGLSGRFICGYSDITAALISIAAHLFILSILSEKIWLNLKTAQ